MRLFAIIVLIVLITGCFGDGRLDDMKSRTSDMRNVIVPINDFALRFIDRFPKETNDIYSPFAIGAVLSAITDASRRNNLKEMLEKINFPKVNRKKGFSMLINKIINDEHDYSIKLLMGFWVNKDVNVLNEYRNLLKRYYGIHIEQVTMSYNSKAASDVINSWAERESHKKFKNILKKLPDSSRFIITSAFYFNDKWEYSLKDTTGEFNTIGNTIEVPMMEGTITIPYSEDKDMQMIELPYKDKVNSMYIIIPKKFPLSLNLKKFNELKKNFVIEPTHVILPKFKFNSWGLLNTALARYGLHMLFNDKADLAGIDGTDSLRIDQFIHQVVFGIDSKGSKRADKKEAKHEFVTDRPFIFFVINKKTGVILVMGKVVDPSKI